MDLETVNQLIASSEPRSRFWRGPTLILLGLSILLGMSLANPGTFPLGDLWAGLLPHLLIIALGAVILYDALRKRRLGHTMQQASEALQMKDWPTAREALRSLLRNPLRISSLRAQSLLALASVCEAEHEYESAQRLCEYVLETRIGNPMQQLTAEVALGAMMLRNGQVTDAVRLIDRLTARKLPGPLEAQVEMLSLFREITMGQADIALEQVERRRELFRAYLGSRAGYGYGLLAATCDRCGQDEAAKQHWRAATLLVPVAELVERFVELKPVAQRYPAAECPF